MFYENKIRYYKHVDHCSGRPRFVYCFQNKNMEMYDKYLNHKKDFPSDIKDGSMFTTSCVLMFDFHPKLNMSLIISLRSIRQSEKGLKHISIPENLREYMLNIEIILVIKLSSY